VGAWDWTVRGKAEGVGSWSPEESGLKGREDFGNAARSNCAKINSKDFVLCVPAVVRGRFTAMDVTSGMPIRKGPRKRGFNATFVILAA
jgi:hypothetical protein